MIDQKPAVYEKLMELEGIVKQVCDEGSQDWSKLPCITYMELQNEPASTTDDEEYSSALAVKVDVWGKKPREISIIAMKVVKKMKELGYERTLYEDINDLNSSQKHKTMRFEKEEPLEEMEDY